MTVEAVEKLISATKKLAFEEEDLKKDLAQLKMDLKAEERNLKDLQAESVQLSQMNASILDKIQYADNAAGILNEFRDGYRSTSVLLDFFARFIDKAHPSSVEQIEEIQRLKENFHRTLSNYEQCPTYQAILQEESTEKELIKLIEEKRAEIMKLSTENVY